MISDSEGKLKEILNKVVEERKKELLLELAVHGMSKKDNFRYELDIEDIKIKQFWKFNYHISFSLFF